MITRKQKIQNIIKQAKLDAALDSISNDIRENETPEEYAHRVFMHFLNNLVIDKLDRE